LIGNWSIGLYNQLESDKNSALSLDHPS